MFQCIIKLHSVFQITYLRILSSKKVDERNVIQLLIRKTLNRVHVIRTGVFGILHSRYRNWHGAAIRFTRNLDTLHNICPYEREHRLFRIPWGLKTSPIDFHWETQVRRLGKHIRERDRNITPESFIAFHVTSPPWPRRKFTTKFVSSTLFSWEYNLRMDTKRIITSFDFLYLLFLLVLYIVYIATLIKKWHNPDNIVFEI